jgi:hypothetical protein
VEKSNNRDSHDFFVCCICKLEKLATTMEKLAKERQEKGNGRIRNVMRRKGQRNGGKQ